MQKPSRPTPWEAVEGDDENPTGMLAYWKDEADEKFTELEQRITELEQRLTALGKSYDERVLVDEQRITKLVADNRRLRQLLKGLYENKLEPDKLYIMLDRQRTRDMLKE